jgi:hypothetical protein
MLNPEYPIFTPEEAMLRDDLDKLLLCNAWKVEITQDDTELSLPALIGIYGKTEELDDDNSINVKVCWIIDGGEAYVDIVAGNQYFTLKKDLIFNHRWNRVATDEDIEEIRYALRQVTEWDDNSTQAETTPKKDTSQ